MSSVKLEGGAEFAETIEAIVRAGIPVMGHLGLTPQSVHQMGGFVVQGREEEQAKAIYRDAQALERAGCYALVLEGIPLELAREITASLRIPTIGIGAGVHCDGQVLVCYDLLRLQPRLQAQVREALRRPGYGVLRGAARGVLRRGEERRLPGRRALVHQQDACACCRGSGRQSSPRRRREPEKIGPVYGVPV